MNIFTQFFTKAQQRPNDLNYRVRQDLLRREAKIGREIFGPVPRGHDREFFRLDSKTWYWQETWTEVGQKRSKITKYVVRDRDVLKSVDGQAYQQISIDEAKNLQAAVHTYVSRVKKDVYNVK